MGQSTGEAMLSVLGAGAVRLHSYNDYGWNIEFMFDGGFNKVYFWKIGTMQICAIASIGDAFMHDILRLGFSAIPLVTIFERPDALRRLLLMWGAVRSLCQNVGCTCGHQALDKLCREFLIYCHPAHVDDTTGLAENIYTYSRKVGPNPELLAAYTVPEGLWSFTKNPLRCDRQQLGFDEIGDLVPEHVLELYDRVRDAPKTIALSVSAKANLHRVAVWFGAIHDYLSWSDNPRGDLSEAVAAIYEALAIWFAHLDRTEFIRRGNWFACFDVGTPENPPDLVQNFSPQSLLAISDQSQIPVRPDGPWEIFISFFGFLEGKWAAKPAVAFSFDFPERFAEFSTAVKFILPAEERSIIWRGLAQRKWTFQQAYEHFCSLPGAWCSPGPMPPGFGGQMDINEFCKRIRALWQVRSERGPLLTVGMLELQVRNELLYEIPGLTEYRPILGFMIWELFAVGSTWALFQCHLMQLDQLKESLRKYVDQNGFIVPGEAGGRAMVADLCTTLEMRLSPVLVAEIAENVESRPVAWALLFECLVGEFIALIDTSPRRQLAPTDAPDPYSQAISRVFSYTDNGWNVCCVRNGDSIYVFLYRIGILTATVIHHLVEPLNAADESGETCYFFFEEEDAHTRLIQVLNTVWAPWDGATDRAQFFYDRYIRRGGHDDVTPSFRQWFGDSWKVLRLHKTFAQPRREQPPVEAGPLKFSFIKNIRAGNGVLSLWRLDGIPRQVALSLHNILEGQTIREIRLTEEAEGVLSEVADVFQGTWEFFADDENPAARPRLKSAAPPHSGEIGTCRRLAAWFGYLARADFQKSGDAYVLRDVHKPADPSRPSFPLAGQTSGIQLGVVERSFPCDPAEADSPLIKAFGSECEAGLRSLLGELGGRLGPDEISTIQNGVLYGYWSKEGLCLYLLSIWISGVNPPAEPERPVEAVVGAEPPPQPSSQLALPAPTSVPVPALVASSVERPPLGEFSALQYVDGRILCAAGALISGTSSDTVAIVALTAKHGWSFIRAVGDGNCFYNAVTLVLAMAMQQGVRLPADLQDVDAFNAALAIIPRLLLTDWRGWDAAGWMEYVMIPLAIQVMNLERRYRVQFADPVFVARLLGMLPDCREGVADAEGFADYWHRKKEVDARVAGTVRQLTTRARDRTLDPGIAYEPIFQVCMRQVQFAGQLWIRNAVATYDFARPGLALGNIRNLLAAISADTGCAELTIDKYQKQYTSCTFRFAELADVAMLAIVLKLEVCVIYRGANGEVVTLYFRPDGTSGEYTNFSDIPRSAVVIQNNGDGGAFAGNHWNAIAHSPPVGQ
jgi:hypothetical protein